MLSLRNCLSGLAALALAGLFGAGCAAGDTTVEDTVGSSQEAQVEYAPAPPPGSGFTFSCAGFWDGVWCGGNQGFPGSPYALYYCRGGVGQLITQCSGLCQAGPSGVEDHC